MALSADGKNRNMLFSLWFGIEKYEVEDADFLCWQLNHFLEYSLGLYWIGRYNPSRWTLPKETSPVEMP